MLPADFELNPISACNGRDRGPICRHIFIRMSLELFVYIKKKRFEVVQNNSINGS